MKITIGQMQTLNEFVEDRKRLNDMKEGISIIHTSDTFICKWR